MATDSIRENVLRWRPNVPNISRIALNRDEYLRGLSVLTAQQSQFKTLRAFRARRLSATITPVVAGAGIVRQKPFLMGASARSSDDFSSEATGFTVYQRDNNITPVSDDEIKKFFDSPADVASTIDMAELLDDAVEDTREHPRISVGEKPGTSGAPLLFPLDLSVGQEAGLTFNLLLKSANPRGKLKFEPNNIKWL